MVACFSHLNIDLMYMINLKLHGKLLQPSYHLRDKLSPLTQVEQDPSMPGQLL